MKKLEPTFSSFIINTPQALSLSTIRPYPSDVKHILSLAAAAETDLLLFLFFLFLLWKKRNGSHSLTFIYFCLFLGFSILITIGYAVNNLGAIVRYRSIVLPLLLVPVFCGIDWQKVASVLFNNIKNKNNVAENGNLASEN